MLVDTGPLVALLAAADQHHDRCVGVFGTLVAPLYSCWPVLTEAAWILRKQPESVDRLLNSVGALVHVLTLDDSDATAIARILQRYRDIRPQLADAALVHLAQRENIHVIFTLDHRDFSVYRSSRNRPFRIVPSL